MTRSALPTAAVAACGSASKSDATPNPSPWEGIN